MKAFLLAAGYGTRLKPITDTIPKCLVSVRSRPLLDHWAELFLQHGIDCVLINTHHLPMGVINYILYSGHRIFWDVRHEETLLGSAGTLRKNKSFVRGEDNFIIAYADVLTDCNLTNLVNKHTENDSFFTMVVSAVQDPTQKGIVQLDGDSVLSFDEKPQNPKGNLANMGIYVCKPEVLDLIPEKPYADIAMDLFPQLLGKMRAYESNEYFCDIGTHDGLNFANNTWRK